MENKLVSVVISTYGRSDRIEECINSLINQTYKNVEIIIVDDNNPFSQDRKQTLKKLKKYSGIKIILMEKNSGACLARNKGIEAAKGEYITFLDDDDIYYPEKIEKQLNFMEKNLDIDFVGCNMKVFLEEKKKYKKDTLCILGEFSKFSIDGILYTPMLMIRKKKIFEVDLFTDTPKFQDHLLILKLLAKGMKWGIVNEALFRHTIHLGERITYTPKYKEALENLEKIENENIECFTKFQKNLLCLKRIRLKLNARQNLERRNYFEEVILLGIYFKYLTKGCRKKEILDGIKILVCLFIKRTKLINLKLYLYSFRIRMEN